MLLFDGFRCAAYGVEVLCFDKLEQRCAVRHECAVWKRIGCVKAHHTPYRRRKRAVGTV